MRHAFLNQTRSGFHQCAVILQPDGGAPGPYVMLQGYFGSRKWHHKKVCLSGFYPPCCRCCTWPPGTADGTCGHTCQACPPARAWGPCAAGGPRSRRTRAASPCRWCNPARAKTDKRTSTCGPRLTQTRASPSQTGHAVLTSSGNTLIFSVYLFTTSSGFFPSHTKQIGREKNAMTKKGRTSLFWLNRKWFIYLMSR